MTHLVILKGFFMGEIRHQYVLMLKNIFAGDMSLGDAKDVISEQHRSFFNMLLMTTFRQLTFIKAEVLPKFIKKKIPHKQQILEFILYLGITELLFLDTPDYAVINSYVTVAKKFTDKFGGNFVNAVLRNILQNKEQLLTTRKIKFFSPDFLKILKQDYTAQEIAEMEDLAAVEPPLDLTLKANYVANIKDSFLLPTGSLRLPAHTKIASLSDYENGCFWAQDAASALPVKCLPNLKDKKVLDLCAAPGGKTAQLLDAGAIVTAVDISEKRLSRLKENIERLNLGQNLTVICTDALKFESDEKFDIILVDAPCSATGTFRRHPEIINTKTIADVKKQALLQKEILKHIISFLAPKGLLVYATCSLAKLEGEKQIKTFLQEHSNFEILPISLKGTENMQSKEGFLRILPQYFKEFSGIDGFFTAILQRKI